MYVLEVDIGVYYVNVVIWVEDRLFLLLELVEDTWFISWCGYVIVVAVVISAELVIMIVVARCRPIVNPLSSRSK